MKENDFKTILNSLNDQGAQQNKYDEEELELTDVFTEAYYKQIVDTLAQYAKSDKAYEFRVFKKEDESYIGGVIIKIIKRRNFQWAEVGY